MLHSYTKVNNTLIESIYIHNDSTGTNEVASYDVTYINPLDDVLIYARVENWKRDSKAYLLINEARTKSLQQSKCLSYYDTLSKNDNDLTRIVK